MAVAISTDSGLTKIVGQSITIEIDVSDLTGENVSAYSFDLLFNESIISITGYSVTGTKSDKTDGLIILNSSVAGTISVAGSFATNLADGAGILIKLTGTALSAGSSNLDLNNVVFNEGTPTVSSTTDGDISVYTSIATSLIIGESVSAVDVVALNNPARTLIIAESASASDALSTIGTVSVVVETITGIVNGATSQTFKIKTGSGAAGVTTGKGIVGILFDLQYDPTKITINSVTQSSTLSGLSGAGISVNLSFAANTIRIVWAAAEEIPGGPNLDLFTINYDAVGEGVSINTLLGTSKWNEGVPTIITTAGSITVISSDIADSLTIGETATAIDSVTLGNAIATLLTIAESASANESFSLTNAIASTLAINEAVSAIEAVLLNDSSIAGSVTIGESATALDAISVDNAIAALLVINEAVNGVDSLNIENEIATTLTINEIAQALDKVLSVGCVPAVAYKIYRSVVSGGPYNYIGQSSSLSAIDILPGEGTYYYKVSACDAVGNESPLSAEVSVTYTIAKTLIIGEAASAVDAISLNNAATTLTIGETATGADSVTLEQDELLLALDSLVLLLNAKELALADAANVDTWPDTSTNSHNAIGDVTNPPIFDEDGLNGEGVVTFDGTAEEMTIPHSTDFNWGTTGFSVLVWFKPDTVGNFVQFFDKRFDVDEGWYVALRSDRSMGIDYGGVARSGINDDGTMYPYFATAGEWRLVVGVISADPEESKWYEGFRLDGSVTMNRLRIIEKVLQTDTPDNTNDIHIGGTNTYSPRDFFDGSIAIMALYNEPLNTDEVWQVLYGAYTQYYTSPIASLLYDDADYKDYPENAYADPLIAFVSVTEFDGGSNLIGEFTYSDHTVVFVSITEFDGTACLTGEFTYADTSVDFVSITEFDGTPSLTGETTYSDHTISF